MFNLLASRKGVALVGAFGSSYTKVVGAAMYGWHGVPAAILSVRDGWEGGDSYKGEDSRFFAAAGVPTLPFDCLNKTDPSV